jgi:hypothetical protein
MNNNQVLILAAAAGIAAVYFLSKKTTTAPAAVRSSSLGAGGAVNAVSSALTTGSAAPSLVQSFNEVDNTALPGQPGYGWRYFTDGTTIDPTGAYYSGGKKVWSPS